MSGDTAVQSYRDLIIWQRAMEFTAEVYRLAKKLPRDERFALTAQLRRAAVSVPSNIAEGHARQGREFKSFLSIARGSLAESETQLLIAAQASYLSQNDIAHALALAEEIRRMASALCKRLE
jgi:four helix bundle protein